MAGETVIRLTASDLKRAMRIPSNATEHYHPLKIMEGLARRICEKGYHRLSYHEASPDHEFLSQFTDFELRMLQYNASCNRCANAYFDGETNRHKEGPVKVSLGPGEPITMVLQSEDIESLRSELPKTPYLWVPDFEF